MHKRKSWPHRRGIELLLFLAYIAVCGILDHNAVTHLDIDSHKYLELGEQFLKTGQLLNIDNNGNLVTDYSRTPVFPALIGGAIGLTGSKTGGVALVLWLQRVLWAAVVLFLMPQILPSGNRPLRRWTLVGKMVLLFSPVVLYHGNMLLTDLLYAALLFAVVRLSLMSFRTNSRPLAVASGIFHGTATLLRPFHAPAPLITCLPWLRKRVTCVSIILLISLTMTLAWMIRNYNGTGKLSMGSIQGRSLALHREAAIRQMEPSQSSINLGPQFIIALKSTPETAYTAAWIIARDHSLTSVQADLIASEVSWEAIQLNPLDYLLGTLTNLRRLFWSRGDGHALAINAGANTTTAFPASMGWINAAWSVVVFLLLPAFLAFTRIPRRLLTSRISVTYLLTALYVIVLPALTTITYGRFLLPALPFIGLLYCAADSRLGQGNFRRP